MNLKITCLSYLEPVDQFVLSSLKRKDLFLVKPKPGSKGVWDYYSMAAQKYILRGLNYNKITAVMTDGYENAILNSQPKLVVTCDAPILSSDFLDNCSTKAINIHFGISKRYRGTHTVFWPLLNGDYESIGLTFHLIDKNIDTGAVLLEYFPRLEKNDTEVSIWRKLAVSAHHLLPQVCEKLISNDDIDISPNQEKGILYLSQQRTLSKEIRLRYMEWTGKLKIPAKEESTIWYI